MTGEVGVEVTRGSLVESLHRVHVAVVDGDGELVAWAGDPARTTFLRSAAKPFQALPLVEDGAAEELGIDRRELAVCCGSHSGEEEHLEAVRSLLARAGRTEEDLECGPHAPLDASTATGLAEAGAKPRPIHNNCSGKHAGMLALAVTRGWPPEGYPEAEHPVQQRILRELGAWTGSNPGSLGTGVDGCGVVTVAVPLRSAAWAFARLAVSASEPETAAATVVSAMREHPFMVGGSGRLCTVLLERAGDRIFAKTGAEGVYGAGLPGSGLGLALKVEDGGRRASRAALLRALSLLGILEQEVEEALASFARPPVLNTLGDRVGEVRATFGLEQA